MVAVQVEFSQSTATSRSVNWVDSAKLAYHSLNGGWVNTAERHCGKGATSANARHCLN